MRTTRIIAAILGFFLASCSGGDHLVFTTGTLPPTTTTAAPATTTTIPPDPVELGVWRPMVESPRDDALAVWTGRELLIMGVATWLPAPRLAPSASFSDDQYAAELRDQVHLERITAEWVSLVTDTLQSISAGIWLNTAPGS